MEEGRLYIVATPIGNLKDITSRAVETLQNSDYIIAEDTRVTQKLLTRFEIKTKAESFHKFNENKKSAGVIDDIKNGACVSLVSDAGTPLLSDPGFMLVKECVAAGVKVEAIPGASSIMAAVVISGFDPGKFMFYGFLDKKPGKKKEEILSFSGMSWPVVIFESPKRVVKTLWDINKNLGDIDCAVIKEITKVYETVFRGSVSAIIKELEHAILKGEFVIVIVPGKNLVQIDIKGAEMRLAELIKSGIKTSEAVKQAAVETGVKKNELYKIANKIKE